MKMKWLIVVLFLCLGARAAEPDYRIFTSKDGRAIEARIVSYDPTTQKLTVERRGKETMRVDAELFCEKDQAYIRAWIAEYSYMSAAYLWVTEERKKDGNSHWHEVSFKNESDTAFHDLHVEYAVFVDVIGYGKRGDELQTRRGSFRVEVLKPGGMVVMATPKRILEEGFVRTGDDNDEYDNQLKVSEERPKGVWMKIRVGSVSVAPIRHACFPSDLRGEVDWPERRADEDAEAKAAEDKLDKKLKGTLDGLHNDLDGLLPAGIGGSP